MLYSQTRLDYGDRGFSDVTLTINLDISSMQRGGGGTVRVLARIPNLPVQNMFVGVVSYFCGPGPL